MNYLKTNGHKILKLTEPVNEKKIYAYICRNIYKTNFYHMNRNKFITFSLLITSIFFLSCGDDDTHTSPSIIGTWTVTERTIDTENEEIDDWINWALRKEHELYNMQVTYAGIDGVDTEGSIFTALKRKDSSGETNELEWGGTYKIEDNTIYLTEERLSQSVAKINILDDKMMVTYTEVTAPYLRNLLNVIGLPGQEDRIPNDITGTIKTRQAR